MVAVLATAMEIASAMRFLHDKDIVHGDLSGGLGARGLLSRGWLGCRG